MPDYLTQVEEQLVALTEQGRHRRRSRVADAALLAMPVAVVVAVVVAVGGVGGGIRHGAVPGRHGQRALHRHGVRQPAISVPPNSRAASPSAEAVPPAGGPVPPGFAPQSFTAIGEYTWWLLGPAPCSSPPCTSIVRTTDGGRTFVGIPAPRTIGVSQLRFADSLNGFAYGPELWVTHDGGATWRQLQVHGVVTELFASDGWVYAIVHAKGEGGVLVRSPVGADRWTPLTAAGEAFSGLWVQGPRVLLESGLGSGDALMSSSDRGASFTRYPVPPSIGCQLESPDPPVVWEHCATGLLSATWRSADGGRTFSPPKGAHAWPGPQQPNSAAFGAASATTAVIGSQKLYRTTDGGASWSPVPGPSGISWWGYLGFTDPTHGVALGFAGSDTPPHTRLYYTTDGGASYHLVRIR